MEGGQFLRVVKNHGVRADKTFNPSHYDVPRKYETPPSVQTKVEGPCGRPGEPYIYLRYWDGILQIITAGPDNSDLEFGNNNEETQSERSSCDYECINNKKSICFKNEC